jgi:hypothetical protein
MWGACISPARTRSGRSPQHELPLLVAGRDLGSFSTVLMRACVMILCAVGAEMVERDLAAGRVLCQSCGERLSPWGFARLRTVRMLRGVREMRPRRSLCRTCATTRVLLPGWSMPRRRDGTEVILAALVTAARGDGHRTIARRLGRPPGTVREWLRISRRDAGSIRLRAEALLRLAEPWSPALGPWVPSAGAPLADAVGTLGHAISAVIRQFGPRQDDLWESEVTLTAGIIAPRAPNAPRHRPVSTPRSP